MSENLPDLKKESSTPSPDVVLGFTNAAGFAMLQRAGQIVASAGEMIPQAYRNNPSRCAIALEMANRLGVHFLAVMQNLYDVHGRPAWSSQFLTAAFNATPGFSKLRYEFKGKDGTDEWSCRAWALERSTNERLEGTWVSIGLAKAEGWYGKNGSKWKTMPEQMLRYRAAAWFIRAYAPEMTMGLQTREEVLDTYDMTAQPDGSFSVSAPDHTADILKRAAQGQEDQEQTTAPTNGTRNKPTKAEMEQRREEAKDAVLEAGLNLEDVEKTLNAYAQNWNTAQCQRAVKMAEETLAEHGVQESTEPQEESFECPNNGVMVRRSVDCAACEQNGLCPMTDGM